MPKLSAGWKQPETQIPLRKREQALRDQQTRLQNHIERMVTAYQEELITLAELRQRIPHLRKQEHAIASELQCLDHASQDQSRYLRIAETLSEFRGKLRARAETLDTIERQKILRLVVQEILVGADTIRIRHSIPVLDSNIGGHSSGPSPTILGGGTELQSCLLSTGSRNLRSDCRPVGVSVSGSGQSRRHRRSLFVGNARS